MKITDYQSQESLRPALLDPSLPAERGRQVEELAQGLGALGEHFEKLKDKSQQTKAEVDLMKRINEIHNSAATSPDIWADPDKLSKEMQKASDESSKLIDSSEARASFQDTASVEVARRSVAINNMLMKRQIDTAKATSMDYVEGKMNEYWNATNENERGVIKQQIVDKVTDAVQSGYMDAIAARTYLSTHLGKLRIGQVTSDMSVDAENTLKELEKGQNGLYKDLTVPERTNLIGKAKNMAEKESSQKHKISMIAQNKSESDMIDKHFAGALTANEVMEAHVNGQVSDRFAQSMVKAIESPATVKGHTDAKEYMDFVDALHKPDADPQALRARLLDDVAKGKISNSVAEHLYTSSIQQDEFGAKTSLDKMVAKQSSSSRQKIIQDDENANAKHNQKKGLIQSAVDYLKSWGKKSEATPERQAEVMQEFFRRTSEEKKDNFMDHAKSVVKEENIKANPSITNAPKEGKLMIDGQGHKALVFPDGSFQEVQ